MILRDDGDGDEPLKDQEPSRNPDGTWPKGTSGNPAGRPVGTFTLSGLIKRKLDHDPDRTDRLIEAFLKILEDGAKRGQVEAFKVALDRIDGPVKNELQITGPSDRAEAIRSAVNAGRGTVPG